MNEATAPISLAGSQLGEMRHVCSFFDDEDDAVICARHLGKFGNDAVIDIMRKTLLPSAAA